jgi:hypothetical protein
MIRLSAGRPRDFLCLPGKNIARNLPPLLRAARLATALALFGFRSRWRTDSLGGTVRGSESGRYLCALFFTLLLYLPPLLLLPLSIKH